MALKSKSNKVVGKADLIGDIANKMEVSKKDAGLMLNAVLESIQDHLKKGEGVRLIPFGSFEIRERKARLGRNPSTGKEIKIKARKVPAFRPGKALRESVK
ncbi:MAG: HU family DNA-binding protein [Candidatus Xenobium sp.]|jgi:DNA-binding protein HU-beta|nr:HU family DNA-binding protein [Burkholderiales bacterium]